MNRAKPTHPHQLGDAARILAVGLDRHRRQRGLHMPRLKKNRLEPTLRQPGMQPLRQRPGFKPDTINRETKPP